MNRRSFLKGVAGVAAGLLVPPTLAENAEAVKRYWPGWSQSYDPFPMGRGELISFTTLDEKSNGELFALWVEAHEPRLSPDKYIRYLIEHQPETFYPDIFETYKPLTLEITRG